MSPVLSYIGNKTRVKFNGSSLKQDEITFTHVKLVNIYTVYEVSVSDSNSNYPTLENSLFGAVKLTKNDDIDKCKYSRYGIAFDRRGTFVHADKKKKDILILDEGPTQV